MAYSPQTWTLLRTLYETGRYHSLEELHTKVSKTIQKCPCLGQIKRMAAGDRGRADPWRKYGLRDQVEGEIKKSTMDLFADAGMPEEQVIKLIVNGMKAGQDSIDEISARIADSIKNRMDLTGKDVSDALRELNNNLMISRQYIMTYMAYTGKTNSVNNLPKKQTEGNPGPYINPRDIPDEELNKRIKELAAVIQDTDHV